MSALTLELQQDHYEPGATLNAGISWQLDEAPATIHIRIGWRTSGIGTEDLEVVDVWTFDADNNQGSQQLQRQLPDFPYSFTGKLITVTWFIEASIDSQNITSSSDLVIAPGEQEIDLNNATPG